MTIVGDRVYAMLITHDAAHAARLDVTGKQVDEQVSALRDTISAVENGQRVTYAFDVGLSHQLYTELFKPFDADLRSVKHLSSSLTAGCCAFPPTSSSWISPR